MTFKPTEEQENALALFATGESMIIEAGAGTGKTATLKLLAETTTRPVQYLAFNKALVEDAKLTMPSHVSCNTAHSLAFRAVGKQYQGRLRSSARMRSTDIARRLRIDEVWVVVGGTERKRLAAGYLAGFTMRALTQFCQTADPAPTVDHFPYIKGIDTPRPDGKPGWDNNRQVRKALLPALQRAWVDAQDPNGSLPYKHDFYLKTFQLSDPHIAASVILFDEAQDASAVLLSIVEQQTHAQIVLVGDRNQAIYGFTGAIDALSRAKGDKRATLTQSFRFGDAVASVANTVLGWLASPLSLRGLGSLPSTVGPVDQPKAILTRTNAAAVVEVLNHQRAGRTVHLVGGGRDVVDFARAAGDLMLGRPTQHVELACFRNWGEVQCYVEQDEQGGELRLMVKLVDEFTVEVIVGALENMTAEHAAEVIVSTAHRSKGRQWDTVRLGPDFPDIGEDGSGVTVDELRLLYVAVTRAKMRLDVEAIPALLLVPAPNPGPEAAPAPAPAPVPVETPINAGPFECHGPGCGRTFMLGRRSGLADERFCGGVCRSKASMAVAV